MAKKASTASREWINTCWNFHGSRDALIAKLQELHADWYDAPQGEIAAAQKVERDAFIVTGMARKAFNADVANLPEGERHSRQYWMLEAQRQFKLADKLRAEFFHLAEKAMREQWRGILRDAYVPTMEKRGGPNNTKAKRNASHKTDKAAKTAKPETAKELGERSIPQFKERAALAPWFKSAAQRPLDGIHQHLNLLADSEEHKSEALAIEKAWRELIARTEKFLKA